LTHTGPGRANLEGRSAHSLPARAGRRQRAMSLDSILAEHKGIGDFDPPDAPEGEAGEPATPTAVWRRDRYGEPIRLVSTGEAVRDVRHTHYWPQRWLGLLSVGQIVATPCFLYGTDYLAVER